jgi:WD40 repeat protein
LEGHEGLVHSAALHPNGKWLATGGADTTIKLWDIATGQLRYTLEGHKASVKCVAFSPDGQRLASGGSGENHRVMTFDGPPPRIDQTVKLWDVASGQLLRTLEGHNASVDEIAFSQDGQWLAAWGGGEGIEVWDGRPMAAAPP